MQFITTDQRIAVENFEIGLIYTVTFTSGSYFLGACIGIGKDYVMFQRTAPELIFSLTMTTAADISGIDPLGDDIGKILEYTGTVPTTIKTNGSPLLDYLITGNTIQNGTPTPDSPIMPEGCGERTGNLFNADSYYANYKSGNSYIATAANFNNTIISPFTTSDIGKTYTISCDITDISSTNVRWVATINGVSVNGDGRSNVGQIKLTFTVATANDSIRITYGSGNYSLTITKIIMNEGSTALSYEPYGYKIPISSAGQTTPVYLGEVETTRKIAKIDLGTLNWGKTASGNFWAATAIQNIRTIDNASTGNAICDMFKEVSSNVVANEPYSFSSCLNTVGRPFINRTGFENLTAEEFKEAMSGVYMYYVLATEETAVANEPLMKIGDYADTLSYRQSGVNIPTTDGLNIFDIDTTVKPSEVYLKYFSPLL